MNLNNKRGFLVNNTWYSVGGKGHEKTAQSIVNDMNWKTEWLNSRYNEAQDFLVFEKAAIKLGASVYPKIIVVSRNYYTEAKIDTVKHMYGLQGYKSYIY